MAYTVKELVKLGLINSPYAVAENEASNYVYIIKEIQAGRLEAKNIGNGKIRNRYLITNSAIADYLNKYR